MRFGHGFGEDRVKTLSLRSGKQLSEDADEVSAHSATDTAVVHLEHLLLPHELALD